MKFNVKLIVVKVVFLLVFIRLFTIINTAISPIIANHLALNQMNNSVDSSLGIRLYSECSQYSWVLIIVAVFILFAEDIGKIINNLKEKEDVKNEEKRN